MLRNILVTFISRFTVTLLGFIVVVMNAHCLGAAGVGTIGLIVLAITIIQLMHNLVGGSIVYLLSREKISGLLMLGYSWALVTSVPGGLILSLLHAFPGIYTAQVIVLSLIISLQSVNLAVLLGQKKFHLYNMLTVLQVAILLITLSFVYFGLNDKTVLHYLLALFISCISSFFISLIYIGMEFKGFSAGYTRSLVRSVFAFGKWVQLSNIFQLFNYRVSYYLVEYFAGRVNLGIFSIGNQVSESLWLPAKSIAVVQYSTISNSKSSDYARSLTLLLLKLSVCITTLLTIIVLIIPGSVYVFIFGNEYLQMPQILASMIIGILAISVTLMLSHYFSGTGKPFQNAIGSGLGLLTNLVAGFIFIPQMGLTGAGLTLSLGYSVNMLYLMIVFVKITKSGPGDFLFHKRDYLLLRQEAFKLFSKRKGMASEEEILPDG